MEIIDIEINNIQIKEELVKSEKTAVTTDKWAITHSCIIERRPNSEFLLFFIPVKIDRYKAGNFATTTIQSVFVVKVKDETNKDFSPSDLYKISEMIVVAKAHARWEFFRRTSQTIFMPSVAPYDSIEKELEKIEPAEFIFR